MAKKPKDMNEEDKALWDAMKEEISPLAGRSPPPEPTRELEISIRPRTDNFVDRLPDTNAVPLAGIDHKRRKRLRRGQIEIETTIDLHGKTQERAFRILQNLLIRAAENGVRTVLVITGKGGRKYSQTDAEKPLKCRTRQDFDPEGGVLRNRLPQWLASPELAPLIVSYEEAAQHHGGKGAFYVILRRIREG